MITSDMTVGRLVAERPSRSRVFEQHGIDYCCGGKKPLEDACAKKGIPAEQVIRELLDADDRNLEYLDCDAMTLDALVDHIVATHHEYLVRELPRLVQMAAKVAKVHGEKEVRLPQLESVVRFLASELDSHMMKEERILFPFIRRLATEQGPVSAPCGAVAHPIAAMEAEHDIAGNALAEIEALTDAFQPPEWACNTYRALFDGLRELQADLHQHIHKENNILFPKTLETAAVAR